MESVSIKVLREALNSKVGITGGSDGQITKRHQQTLTSFRTSEGVTTSIVLVVEATHQKADDEETRRQVYEDVVTVALPRLQHELREINLLGE